MFLELQNPAISLVPIIIVPHKQLCNIRIHFLGSIKRVLYDHGLRLYLCQYQLLVLGHSGQSNTYFPSMPVDVVRVRIGGKLVR